MNQLRKRRVCLFGTSADPPTGIGGHLGIAKYLASMDAFDEVRILPVYSHMFGVSISVLKTLLCFFMNILPLSIP